MEHRMRLHENQQLFADAIEAAARPVQDGGLGIKSIFIEKDYWICRCRLWLPETRIIVPFSRAELP